MRQSVDSNGRETVEDRVQTAIARRVDGAVLWIATALARSIQCPGCRLPAVAIPGSRAGQSRSYYTSISDLHGLLRYLSPTA